MINFKNSSLLCLIASVSIALLAGGQGQAQTIQRNTDIFAIKGTDTLRMDTYIDTQAEVKPEGRPVLIYIHGGGFTTGSRVNAAQESFCRYMAAQGFLTAAVEYRLAGMPSADPSAPNPYGVQSVRETVTIACEDVVEAINYILDKSEWKANPKLVSVSGGSAGAITALTVVYDVCNGADYTKALPEGFSFVGAISHAGAVSTLEDELTWKTKPCPIFFFHGTQDELVPLDKQDVAGTNFMGTTYLTTQFEKMDVPHWTWIEVGADHVMAMKPLTAYLEEQARFLKEFVIGEKHASVKTEWSDETPDGMQSVEQMIKVVPLYILGFGKYLEEIDWLNMPKPDAIVY